MNILLTENNFPLIYILPLQFPSGIIRGDTEQEKLEKRPNESSARYL